MSSFLRSSSVAIKGIALPITQPTIPDAKFTDDMTLYVDGDMTNLARVHNAL